jgi:hypothetical protein
VREKIIERGYLNAAGNRNLWLSDSPEARPPKKGNLHLTLFFGDRIIVGFARNR